MKTITLVLFFVLSQYTIVLSQHYLVPLEEAYVAYEAGSYKKASKAFDQYLKEYPGDKWDYFFAAVAFAKSKKRKETKAYLEMFVHDYASLQVVLNEPSLAKFTSEYREEAALLKALYAIYSPDSRHSRLSTWNPPADSTERIIDQVPKDRLSYFDIGHILRFYKRQKNEAEVAEFQTLLDKKKKVPVLLEDQGYYNKRYNDLSARLPFLMRKAEKDEKARNQLNYVRQVVDSLSSYELSLIHPGHNGFWAMLYLSEGEEKKALRHLQALLLHRFEISYLGEILSKFPNAVETVDGQALLKLFVQESLYATSKKADTIFSSQALKSEQGKRWLYQYQEATNFDHKAPRHLFKSQYMDEEGKPGSEFYFGYEQLLREIKHQYFPPQIGVSEAGSLFINSFETDKRSVKWSDERILMLESTSDDRFYAVPGKYYSTTPDNLALVRYLQDRKAPFYQFTEIKEKLVRPLRATLLLGRLEQFVSSDDECFMVAIDNGVENTFGMLPELIKISNPEQLVGVARFIRFTGTDEIETFKALIERLREDEVIEAFATHMDELRAALTALNKYHHWLDDRASTKPKRHRISSHVDRQQWKDSLNMTLDSFEQWWRQYQEGNPFEYPTTMTKNLENKGELLNDLKNFLKGSNGELLGYLARRNARVSSQPILVTEEALEEIEEDLEVFVALDDDRQRPGFVKSLALGEKRVIFSPSHHTSPDFISLIQGGKEEVNKMNDLAQQLRLQARERISYPSGSFNIRYETMMGFEVFGKNLIAWFDTDTLYLDYLDRINLKGPKTALKVTGDLKYQCRDEILSTSNLSGPFQSIGTLDWLNVIEIAEDRALVSYSKDTWANQSCVNANLSAVHFELIDKELNVVKSVTVPEILDEQNDLSSNPIAQVYRAGNYLYLIINTYLSDFHQIQWQVFDLELNPVTELLSLTKTFEEGRLDLPGVGAVGDKLYVAYPSDWNGEQLLVYSELNHNGIATQPVAIDYLEGAVEDMIIVEKNGLPVLKMIEELNDKYYLKEAALK